MFKRIVLAVMLALTSVGANAACNPANAPPNSIGCQPSMPSNLQATDLILGWRPSLANAASRSFTPSQLLEAGLPGAFSSLSATGSFTLGGALSVGTNLSVGGSAVVLGNTTLGSTATVGSTLGVLGDFSVAANKFVVLSASGNTVTAGTFDAAGTITGAGSIIAGNGGTAPITLQSGIISVPASQSLSIRTTTAGQSVTVGSPASGLGNALTVTPNSNGNSLFGALPNNVQASNLMTVSRLTNTGITTALSGTVTPTAITGSGSTVTVTFPAIAGVVIPVGSQFTLSGVTPIGYNKSYTVVTSTNTQVTATDTTTGTVTVFGSMAYKMLSPYIMNFTTNWTGTPIAGQRFSPYRFAIASDQADTNGTGQGADVVEISHNWLGAATGGKLGMQVTIAQVGATNDTGSQQHVVANLHAQAGFNAGGTGTGTNSHGTLYGINPQTRLLYGATRWALTNALGEINTSVNSNRVDVTLGGTITAADVVTLTFASADIVGSPVAVSWTIGAGQTLTTVGNNLEAAVNNNTALRNAKIAAVARAGVVSIHYDTHLASLTLTPSTSGGATITVAAGSLVAGASVDNKIFASMIRLNDDDQPGSLGSGFLAMASQPDAAQSGRYDWGIGFGGFPTYNGTWPWHQGSTLIGSTYTPALGGTGKSGLIPPNVAKYGVDWRYTNFTQGSGLAFRSANFSVDGTGILALGGFTATPSSTGMALDMTGKQASAVALASGGGGGGTAIGNYFIGDVGFDDYNGQYLATGVSNTTGAVTTFTVLAYPSYASGAAPTNPITVNAGSGAGWTVNATWPSTVSLILQATGGNTRVGTGSALATNATSGFLLVPTTAGSPTGAVGAAGQAAIIVNTTGNKLCWSVGGGTWKDAVGGAC